MSPLVTRIDRVLRVLELASMYLAAAGLMAIMIIVVVDVALRYVFSAPLSWSYDVVSMYLVTVVIFMALSDGFRSGIHIKVDLIQRLQGTRLLALAEIVGYCASMTLFGLILHELIVHGLTAFINAEVVAGAIAWPTWPPHLVASIGVALLFVRIGLSLTLRIVAFASGQALPPTKDAPAAEGHH
jgi:TRAP-type C4-dicarboxylate transport system permease small subunit